MQLVPLKRHFNNRKFAVTILHAWPLTSKAPAMMTLALWERADRLRMFWKKE